MWPVPAATASTAPFKGTWTGLGLQSTSVAWPVPSWPSMLLPHIQRVPSVRRGGGVVAPRFTAETSVRICWGGWGGCPGCRPQLAEEVIPPGPQGAVGADGGGGPHPGGHGGDPPPSPGPG